MRRSLVSPTLIAVLAGTKPALAHPGRGLDASGVGLLHFLLDLSHGGAAVLVAAVAAGVIVIAELEARRGERS